MIKVVQHTTYDDEYSKMVINIYKDGALVDGLTFQDGELEDNTLFRNFSGVFNIIDLMQRAYQAGKNGEEIVFEKQES